MNKKIRVGLIFGGKSAEHEVSLLSAKNILDAIDNHKYEVWLIGIEKTGKWYLLEEPDFLLNESDPKLIKLNIGKEREVVFVPQGEGELVSLMNEKFKLKLDVVFPILHGPFGEDGTMQGLFKLINVPYVGAGVLGSAIGMDKDVMKRLLRDAGIPIATFLVFKKGERIDFGLVRRELGLPVFIKSSNLGSSVGISKVNNKREFERAVNNAFLYDTKILIEELIKGREIECSVLGNQSPRASVPGEIILNHDEFYSYEAKYVDEKGVSLMIPADISSEEAGKVQDLAIKAFKVLECEEMGRVDFFLKDDGELIVIEINTIPGFTKNSMYPRLWEASGIKYHELIDQLIGLAIERFEREENL